KDETLEIEEMNGGFRSWAKVQAVSIGGDNLPRLGIMFLEDDAPLRAASWLKRIGVAVDPAEAVTAAEPASSAAAPVAPVELRALQFDRVIFDECRESEHAVCPAG